MRRRTREARASRWTTGPPTARVRLPDTTSPRAARVRRRRWADACPARSHLHRAALALIVLDPVDGRAVQVAHQDLLVAEWVFVDDVVLERRLCAAQHAGILQGELLEHHG